MPDLRRPLSITIVACLFVAAGAIGFVAHAMDFRLRPFQSETVWILAVRLIAVVCGLYLLGGRNWARWLALAWMAFHVVLSAFHSIPGLVIHTLFLALLVYFLFRPRAAQYFRSRVNAAT